jgi:hypothetical protein
VGKFIASSFSSHEIFTPLNLKTIQLGPLTRHTAQAGKPCTFFKPMEPIKLDDFLFTIHLEACLPVKFLPRLSERSVDPVIGAP